MSVIKKELPVGGNIKLWSSVSLGTEGFNEGSPSITPYLLEGEGRFPAVIICQGGSYIARAFHEGEPIARWLNEIGISAIILNYRVAPFTYPTQLMDAQRAIRMVRHHSADWNLDSDRIGILGFSAGGHLASTAGTHYDNGNPQAEDPIEWQSSRPDLMVLCYPLISMTQFANEGCIQTLLGERHNDSELLELLSNEKQITADTPPAFLWSTVEDTAVPVENSLMFVEGLRKHGVAFALHLFEKGSHGLGLGIGDIEAEAWPKLCEAWFKRRQFLKAQSTFNEYSTLGELLSNEQAKAILEQYLPEINSLELDQAKGYSIKMLFSFPLPIFTEEKLKAIVIALITIKLEQQHS